jgi:hypothetical protein
MSIQEGNWGDSHLCWEELEHPSQHSGQSPAVPIQAGGRGPTDQMKDLQSAFRSRRLLQRSQALDEKGGNKTKSPPVDPTGWKLACSFEAKSQLEDQQPARRSDALSAQPKTCSAQNHQRHAPRQLVTRAIFQPDYKASQNRAALPHCILHSIRRTTPS